MVDRRDEPGPDIRGLLRVPSGGPVDLAAINPRSTPGLPGMAKPVPKRWSASQAAEIGAGLAESQQRLYAAARNGSDRRRLLLVLQAMDCGGKDGTIKYVVAAMNPQGVRVASFGVPTPQERQHDFLWRIRRAAPGPGYVGVFNRSHYEDVLVARVHELVSRDVWLGRYDQINQFERKLVDDGVTIVKVMLHISTEEQCTRLRQRLTDPTRYWKYNPADLGERLLWPRYQEAYADALVRCSTEHAPWYVVPADRKWYRNWAVSNLLLETLTDMNPTYPPPHFDLPAELRRLDADCAPRKKAGRR